MPAGNSQQTLLQMTQEILQSMQSDQVTSITDTAESTAVATCIQRTYWDLFGLEDLPEHYTLFKLTETSTATPNLMTIPLNCMKLDWVKYNVETLTDTNDQFMDVGYVETKQFLDRQLSLLQGESNVASYTYTFSPLGTDTVEVLYTTGTRPRFYTSPDDYNLIFDGLDTSVDTFLRSAKTLAWGLIDPVFTFSDSFTPDLDVRQYAMLFNESKAQAFVELKQTQNAKAEQRGRRLMISAQKTKNRTPNLSALDRLPNYGRRAGQSVYNPALRKHS